jgi:hypothetical protein
MIIEKVVSGGQSGADQAGWRAAKAAGIATGGWMPFGFKTEDGPRPEFAGLYGAKEHRSSDYRDRTISNIGLADVSILFGDPSTHGSLLLKRVAADVGKPVFKVRWHDEGATPSYMVGQLERWGGRIVVNVAGNRESSSPGIGDWVESYLAEVFRIVSGNA